MGEIIIKVPGDMKKIVEIEKVSEIIAFLDNLIKMDEQNKAIEYILSHAGSIPKDFNVSEEELHLQED